MLPSADGGHVVRSTTTAAGAHVVSLVGNSPQVSEADNISESSSDKDYEDILERV